METPVTAPIEASAPAPAPAPAPVMTAPAQSPTPTYEDGGAMSKLTGGKMKIVDIFISAIVIGVGIYSLIFYRKAIKKLEEQPTAEEFDNMSGDIEEVKYNLKKALGKKYQTT